MTAHLNALPAIYSRQGGVGTSGMLTLRDPQTMTTDLHAEVGWSRPRLELDRVQRPASGRRMASHRPGASRASGHLGERAHGAPARRGGAVDPVEDKAHVAVAPLACDRPSGGRQGRDLRLSVPCPIRVQTGAPWGRFRWSGPCGATPSGAVSAYQSLLSVDAAIASRRTGDNSVLPPVTRYTCTPFRAWSFVRRVLTPT